MSKCSAITYSGAVKRLAEEWGKSDAGEAALDSAREHRINVDGPLDVDTSGHYVTFLAASNSSSESVKSSIGFRVDTVEHQLSRVLGVTDGAAWATVVIPMDPLPPGLSRYFQDGLRACAQNTDSTTAARLQAASKLFGAK